MYEGKKYIKQESPPSPPARLPQDNAPNPRCVNILEGEESHWILTLELRQLVAPEVPHFTDAQPEASEKRSSPLTLTWPGQDRDGVTKGVGRSRPQGVTLDSNEQCWVGGLQ